MKHSRLIQSALPHAPRSSARCWPALTLLCALSVVGNAAAGTMFRWVDEKGEVHYTDQIPPSQSERGHATMSKQGSRMDVVAPAKSPEELQREAELENQRAQQTVLREQQMAADRVLLRTYHSADDMLMARDGKVAALDVAIQVARGTVRQQQDRMRKLRSEAADLERAGKPIPQTLTDSLQKSERTIRESYETIVAREQDKAAIRQDFDGDLKRFRQLKNLPDDPAAAPPEAAQLALRNLVTCPDTAQCDLYWGRALAYVQAHATTKIEASGATMLITAPPETPQDVGLTLSRIPDKQGSAASIFLDLQCRNKSPANANCSADNANAAKVLNKL